jgi:integrase
LDKRELLAALSRAIEAEEKPSPTFRVLWERWADVHRGRLQDFGTEEGRARHLLKFFGEKHVGGLTIFDIDGEKGYRAQRLTKMRGGGKLRPATRNREVDLLNRVLNFAVEESLITRNPVAHAPAEPEGNIQHSKIESEAKLLALLKAAPNALVEALILCWFETGARRMEIMAMRWDQFEGEWLIFPRTKNKEPRRVKLAPRALEAVQALRRYHGCPWVFANPDTLRPYSPRYLARLFERTVADSGLQGVNGETLTPHKFRHGMAYRLRRVFKTPQATAMKMLGQKTDAAYRRYGITDEEESEEAWNTVALGGPQKAVDRKPPQRVPLKLPNDADLATSSRI